MSKEHMTLLTTQGEGDHPQLLSGVSSGRGLWLCPSWLL